jgi:hypothetical protein
MLLENWRMGSEGKKRASGFYNFTCGFAPSPKATPVAAVFVFRRNYISPGAVFPLVGRLGQFDH